MHAKKYSFNENTNELDVDPWFIAEGVSFAKQNNYKAIRILAMNDDSIGKPCALDLTPLSGNKFISALTISDSFKVATANVDAIYNMEGLRKLSFRDKKIKLDFSRMTQLETLHMQHNSIPVGFSLLKNVTDLLITSLNNKDCSFLEGLASLKQFRISGGAVETLSGAEALQNLIDVRIDHCAKLKDISALGELKHLAILHVEKCKSLTDYSFLAGNDSIENLFASDLDSISFVANMKRIRLLKFWNVKDGDLTPALKSKSLKKVDFYPEKKHYNHTKAELNALLAQREQ